MHFGILDAPDDPRCPAAGQAGLDADTENPCQPLRPGHRGTTFGRWSLPTAVLTAPVPHGRCHPRAVFTVWRD